MLIRERPTIILNVNWSLFTHYLVEQQTKSNQFNIRRVTQSAKPSFDYITTSITTQDFDVCPHWKKSTPIPGTNVAQTPLRCMFHAHIPWLPLAALFLVQLSCNSWNLNFRSKCTAIVLQTFYQRSHYPNLHSSYIYGEDAVPTYNQNMVSAFSLHLTTWQARRCRRQWIPWEGNS